MATIDLTLSDDSDLEVIDHRKPPKKLAQTSQFKSNALGSTADAFRTPFSASSKKHPAPAAFEEAASTRPNANQNPLADSYYPQESRYEPAVAPFKRQEPYVRKTGSNSIPLGPRRVTGFNPAAPSFAPQSAGYDALGGPGYGAAPPSFLPQSTSYGALSQAAHGSGPNLSLSQFTNYAAHGHPSYRFPHPQSVQPANHESFGLAGYNQIYPDQPIQSIESDAPASSSFFNQARYNSNIPDQRARFPNPPTEQLPGSLPLSNPAIYVAQQTAPAGPFISTNRPTWEWARAPYPFPQPGPLPQLEQRPITRRRGNLVPALNWYANDSIVGEEFGGPAPIQPASINSDFNHPPLDRPSLYIKDPQNSQPVAGFNNDLEYQALANYLGSAIASLEMSKPVGKEPRVHSSFNHTPVKFKDMLTDLSSGKKQVHELESPERDESEEKKGRGAANAGVGVVRFEDLESPDKEDLGGGGEYSYQPRPSLPHHEGGRQVQGSNISSRYPGFDNLPAGAPRPQNAYYHSFNSHSAGAPRPQNAYYHSFDNHPAGFQVPRTQQAQVVRGRDPGPQAGTWLPHSRVPPPPTQQPSLQHHQQQQQQQHSNDQTYKNSDEITLDSDSEIEAHLSHQSKRRRRRGQHHPRSAAVSTQPNPNANTRGNNTRGGTEGSR